MPEYLTAVKRVKFAKNCSKFDTLPVFCWFNNFFGTLLKKVLSMWNRSNSDLLTPFVKAILPGYRTFKSKETSLCERNGNFTLSSYYIYPWLVFPLHGEWNVREMKRKAAWDVWPRWTRVLPLERANIHHGPGTVPKKLVLEHQQKAIFRLVLVPSAGTRSEQGLRNSYRLLLSSPPILNLKRD